MTQHLTLQERYRIDALKASGNSYADIARTLDRSRRTIERELKRCSPYDPQTAHQQALTKRTHPRPSKRKLTDDYKNYLNSSNN